MSQLQSGCKKPHIRSILALKRIIEDCYLSKSSFLSFCLWRVLFFMPFCLLTLSFLFSSKMLFVCWIQPLSRMVRDFPQMSWLSTLVYEWRLKKLWAHEWGLPLGTSLWGILFGPIPVSPVLSLKNSQVSVNRHPVSCLEGSIPGVRQRMEVFKFSMGTVTIYI